jgi:hypothetical protein
MWHVSSKTKIIDEYNFKKIVKSITKICDYFHSKTLDYSFIITLSSTDCFFSMDTHVLIFLDKILTVTMSAHF